MFDIESMFTGELCLFGLVVGVLCRYLGKIKLLLIADLVPLEIKFDYIKFCQYQSSCCP